ncbi:MAG: TraB/GumN family protein, partial [Myxococcota bacterium]
FSGLLFFAMQRTAHATSQSPPQHAKTTQPSHTTHKHAPPISRPQGSSTHPRPLMLWEAQGRTHRVYLLGSIHVANASLYPLPQTMQTAFRRAKTLVIEAQTSGPVRQRIAQLTRTYGLYPPGQSLATQLSAKGWNRLKQYMQKNRLPISRLQRFRPWLLALTLNMLELRKHGITGQYGLDKHFEQRAQGRKIPVQALETAEQQLKLFYNLSAKAQETYLLSSIDEQNSLHKDFQRLLASWKRGDTQALEKILFRAYKDLKKHPELQGLYQRIFTLRNRKMAALIQTRYLPRNNDTFIVVGAGHLVGQQSIVSILRKKGFSVRQLHRQNLRSNPPKTPPPKIRP